MVVFDIWAKSMGVLPFSSALTVATGTGRADLLNELAQQVIEYDWLQALTYCRESVMLASVLNAPARRACGLLTLRRCERRMSNFSASEGHLRESLVLFGQLGDL